MHHTENRELAMMWWARAAGLDVPPGAAPHLMHAVPRNGLTPPFRMAEELKS